MTYPVHQVTYPSDLDGVTNGNLTGQLVSVLFQGRGTARTHKQTARAFAALSDAVLKKFGVTLTITSLGDAYRSYQSQVTLFLQRYETPPVPGRATKTWNGVVYSIRYVNGKPLATAATPGSSNHGWGLALDICEIKLGGQTIGISTSACWSWLLANANLYGFSWETQTEPWHIRLYTGDYPTQAVIEYEKPTPPPFPPPIPPNPVYDDDTMYLAILSDGSVIVVGSRIRPVSSDEIAVGGPYEKLPRFTPPPGSNWHIWLRAGLDDYIASIGM